MASRWWATLTTVIGIGGRGQSGSHTVLGAEGFTIEWRCRLSAPVRRRLSAPARCNCFAWGWS
jgi:hypothetical protein